MTEMKVKVISQETFESVVLENVTDLDYSVHEAIDEAIQEFTAQGISLSNIVTEFDITEDNCIIHNILKFVNEIDVKHGSEINGSVEEFIKCCKMNLAQRLLATKHGAYNILLQRLKVEKEESTLRLIVLAMAALSETNSDILDHDGMVLMHQLMSDFQIHDKELPDALANWSLEVCMKHEHNRQSLVEIGIPGKLVDMLKTSSDATSTKSCCKALRAFTLDDDIRTPYGKTHDHARLLVEEYHLIKLCLEFVDSYIEDKGVVAELLSTLSRLCVRAEYCTEAYENNALVVINNILANIDNASLLKQAINLLKTICGNDKVKNEAMKTNTGTLVIIIMQEHINSIGLCEASLGAISMMALREPKNATQLLESGAADAVLQVMKTYPNEELIQKLGCMAVRNLACHKPENKAILIECQVESVIQVALQNFSSVKDMGKAALRDLDLDVHLEEQWKGTGVELKQ